jgi:hypothetical protein
LFNLATHGEEFGCCLIRDREKLFQYLEHRDRACLKNYTSAHMTRGVRGEDKYKTTIKVLEESLTLLDDLLTTIDDHQSLESLTEHLQVLPTVGGFLAYEIACDCRFYLFNPKPNDILTWANLGGGAVRGMQRLGMEPTVDSMVKLYVTSCRDLPARVKWAQDFGTRHYPFELREIEHNLCEFDKYRRAATGVGRPRQKFNGTENRTCDKCKERQKCKLRNHKESVHGWCKQYLRPLSSTQSVSIL